MTDAPLVWEVVFRLRNVLAALPVIFALFSTHWEWENDFGIWSIALTFCALGIGLRVWSGLHCHYGLGTARRQLATTGPYSMVRNPLYLGNLCLLIGATVASGLQWLLPVTIGWALLIFHVVVLREERRLERNYGAEFTQYCAEVPRWIPRFKPANPWPQVRKLTLLESRALLILVPFLCKELGLLGLGS